MTDIPQDKVIADKSVEYTIAPHRKNVSVFNMLMKSDMGKAFPNVAAAIASRYEIDHSE